MYSCSNKFGSAFLPPAPTLNVPLGTHTIPKLIFDIDKSAYYKAILAIFLRIDFCLGVKIKKTHPSGSVW